MFKVDNSQDTTATSIGDLLMFLLSWTMYVLIFSFERKLEA